MKDEEWDNFRISATNFYTEERDKIKENWFLYELSNGIYDELIDDKTIFEKYREQELLELSLNLSRCGKEIVQNLLKKGKKVKITNKDIQQKLAKNFQLIYERQVIRVATNAINSLVSACLHCPTKCIYDWKGKCYMFDTGPY